MDEITPATGEDWRELEIEASTPEGHTARAVLELLQRLVRVEPVPAPAATTAPLPRLDRDAVAAGWRKIRDERESATAAGLSPMVPAPQAPQGVTVEELVQSLPPNLRASAERLVAFLDECAADGFSMIPEYAAELRAALAAAPPAPDPQHVGTLHVSDFRGYTNYEFQQLGDLPVGQHKLFTAPPAPVSWALGPWERPGWCDAEGRCWFAAPVAGVNEARWTLTEPLARLKRETFFLPHWAIPIPQPPQGGEVAE